MRLDDQNESSNVEDRRGSGFGGGGLGRGGLGLGSIVVALVASYFLGIDPMVILGLFSGTDPSPAPQCENSQHL